MASHRLRHPRILYLCRVWTWGALARPIGILTSGPEPAEKLCWKVPPGAQQLVGVLLNSLEPRVTSPEHDEEQIPCARRGHGHSKRLLLSSPFIRFTLASPTHKNSPSLQGYSKVETLKTPASLGTAVEENQGFCKAPNRLQPSAAVNKPSHFLTPLTRKRDLHPDSSDILQQHPPDCDCDAQFEDMVSSFHFFFVLIFSTTGQSEGEAGFADTFGFMEHNNSNSPKFNKKPCT